MTFEAKPIVAAILERERVGAFLAWTVLGLVTIWLLLAASPLVLYIAGLVIIYAISALGLDWIQGRAGQISIGNAAFMAIGAYLTAGFVRSGASSLVALVLSALGGAVVGLVIGLPALRLRGIYLAFSTLALQFIAVAAGTQYEEHVHASAGLTIPRVAVGSLELHIGRSFDVALLVIFVLVVIVLQSIYRRAPGRAWLAIKESQIAAGVMGINPTRWKLSAFVASSALISMSGSLLALYTGNVTSVTFSLAFAISFVAMLIIGGEGSITGVVLGAALITSMPYVLTQLTGYLPAGSGVTDYINREVYNINIGLYGLLLLAFLIFQPRGIGGALERAGRSIRTRAERWSAAPGAAPAVRATSPAIRVSEQEPADARTIAAPSSNAVLSVRDLHVVYRSGAHAVEGVNLDVNAGEVVAVLGRNGVGKTSTLRAISGFMAGEAVRVSGEINFGGRNICGMSPGAISKRGAILVPERDKVFPNLTVAEHLRLARSDDATIEAINDVFPALRGRSSSPAGLLSGGERQMLALALAWCLEPKLLMIDELSLGLGPGIIKSLMAAVQELRAQTGVPILLVEQSIGSALEIADRVYILEAGEVIRAAGAAEVSRDYLATASLIGVA